LGGKPEHAENLGVSGEIILDWQLRKMGWGRCGLDASGSGQGPVEGSSEHGNETSDSIKGGEFFD
jgi:hypothetical protein